MPTTWRLQGEIEAKEDTPDSQLDGAVKALRVLGPANRGEDGRRIVFQVEGLEADTIDQARERGVTQASRALDGLLMYLWVRSDPEPECRER